ncbi:unnamed protein product [Adineta ricciae]|uniref:Uncharacterized protein n=1 Tax=Adineta ricciae TaxID=249248 RepID=A0A815NEI0_ADIRI|nr:unnamed protein product [Adineta ricciae]
MSYDDSNETLHCKDDSCLSLKILFSKKIQFSILISALLLSVIYVLTLFYYFIQFDELQKKPQHHAIICSLLCNFLILATELPDTLTYVHFEQFINTHLKHYLPIALPPILLSIWYTVLIFFYPCQQFFDYTQLWCIGACYVFEGTIGTMDDLVYLNANPIQGYDGYRSNLELGDTYLLTVDCDHKVIRLTNERTNEAHVLDVDPTKCPLPWQLNVRFLDHVQP